MTPLVSLDALWEPSGSLGELFSGSRRLLSHSGGSSPHDFRPSGCLSCSSFTCQTGGAARPSGSSVGLSDQENV